MKRIVIVAALVFFGFSTVLAFAAPATNPKPPIKIGLLTPLTGALALEGRLMRNGLVFAFEKAGDIAGRKVEITVEDDESKPDVAITKARKLRDADKIHILVGSMSGSVGLALVDFAAANQIPHVMVNGNSALEFITTKLSKWSKHPWEGGNLFDYGVAEYMVKNLGCKRIIIMAPDYVWGQNHSKFVKAQVEGAGGEVVQVILTPEPTLDFSAYLSNLKEADGLMPEYSGAEAARVVKQFREYGIKMEIGGVPPKEDALPDMGDAGIGMYGGSPYYTFLDNPENKVFVKGYKERFKGEDPMMTGGSTYCSTLLLIDVLRRIGGNVEDKTAFINAWYQIKGVATPAGKLGYEKETESGIWDHYITKVVKKEGKLGYEVLKVYPGIAPTLQLRLMGILK